MQLLRRAHEMAMLKIEEMKKLLEQNPDFRDQIEYNMKHYGVPFISGSYGARWREDLVKDVRNILFGDFPSQLMEIRIYPEDPDGHHWALEYNLLLWDEEKGMIKAIDYERAKKGGDTNG